MDALQYLTGAVKAAAEARSPVDISGGCSKRFLGCAPPGSSSDVRLDTRQHSGVMSYVPEELMLRVRGGTPLAEVRALLAEQHQMLACEPPCFGGAATIGGAVAAGLSGSRRPYAGGVKDFVLGVGLVNGQGVYNQFGGQVMKNVAGYDVSRLVCGSLGILGVIADVSLKVLPVPACEKSIRLVLPLADGIQIARTLAQRVSTLTGACYLNESLHLRFSGVVTAVNADIGFIKTATGVSLGGAELDNSFWQLLDDQQCEPFASATDVWRLSTRASESLTDAHYDVVDWGGAQRWLIDPPDNPRDEYKDPGHWTHFRTAHGSREGSDVFHPLSAVHLQLHRHLKQVFDPQNILNPGRMYPQIDAAPQKSA